MVPEAVPYDTDPTSQLRFLGTLVHLHEHTKLHVLCPHEPSLEAKEVWWRISDRQAVIFAILRVVAPGVEYFVPLSPIGQLSSDGVCMIGGALFTGGHGCVEVEPFAASAFDHDALRTPLVDLAKFDVLNFIACFGALDYLSHRYGPPFPFTQQWTCTTTTTTTAHKHKGWVRIFLYLVILSVLVHENLVPIR
jgi:hypothetical protein